MTKTTIDIQAFINEHPFTRYQWMILALCFITVAMAEDLHPNGGAEDHQNDRSQQAQPAADHRAAGVSFDQYIDSRIIGKLQLAAMEKARPTMKAIF